MATCENTDKDGSCYPRCGKCHAHTGGSDEPHIGFTCDCCDNSYCDDCDCARYQCDKCECGTFCGDCCNTTAYDEYGCCEECAPDDAAVPAAEEAVASAPAAAADDATDADDAAQVVQVTAAMAQVAVKAAGSSLSGSSSDSDGDGNGDDGSGAEAVAALASKPYSELQAMAKARGIRANTKKEVMIKALNEATGEQ